MPDATEVKNQDRATHARNAALVNNGLMPLLAVFTGLVVGGLIIAASNDAAIAAWRNFFQAPGLALKASWDAISTAYGALFAGALGKPGDIIAAFQSYSDATATTEIYTAIYPITES